MKIQVEKIIGLHCTEYEQGDRIFAEIRKALDAGEIAEVDMQGVQLATSAFFNAAVGPLYSLYPRPLLQAKMKLLHLSPEMQQVLIRSLDAARKFYADTETVS